MPGEPLPLHDIHLPLAPGGWPLAPGWWLLASVLLAAAWFALRTLRRHWRRTRLRRARQRLFDELLAAAHGGSARLTAISQLLRRAARAQAGQRVASLAGEDWLRFLDGEDPGQPFSRGPGRIVLDGPFRAPPSPAADDAPATLAVVEALARQRYLQLLEPGNA